VAAGGRDAAAADPGAGRAAAAQLSLPTRQQQSCSVRQQRGRSTNKYDLVIFVIF
jgi:hypothetical protein